MTLTKTTVVLSCLAIGALLASLPVSARGEVIVLKSGGRLEGDLLNAKRAKDDPVEVAPLPGFKVTLAPAQVARVIVKSDVQKQYETELPKVEDTVDGHTKMAQWCADAGLAEERKFHLQQIIRLNPDHEAARTALGYGRIGSTWMTHDEYMAKQGYVRHAGRWSLPQEVEIEKNARQWELDTKAARKQFKLWMEWLSKRKAAEAYDNIRAVRDEAFAPVLVETLLDSTRPRELRLACLNTLTHFPPGYSAAAFIKLAMNDPDMEIADKCLEELQRQGSQRAVAEFTKGLKSKLNSTVNRAAHCLQRLGDQDATVPLIDALVTTHKFMVTTGQPPGGMSLGFGGGDGAASDGGGGLGSMSMGGKPKIITQNLKNESALNALTSLHQGINFGYVEQEWRNWYIQSHTSPEVNLRRGE